MKNLKIVALATISKADHVPVSRGFRFEASFASFLRIWAVAEATDYIPRDRIIDGIRQTAVLLEGEGTGRRDYAYACEGPVPRSDVKQEFKMHLPAPGQPGAVAPTINVLRDLREEHPLVGYSLWAGASFKDMVKRHQKMIAKYPHLPLGKGVPYEGIENLRPESKLVRETFQSWQSGPAYDVLRSGQLLLITREFFARRPILMARTLCSALVLAAALTAQSAQANDVRLVVQITVDGLRGDLLNRYNASLGPDGFRRLMDGGVWYTNAHHDHANTETIVGHATLATGAHPSEHGMIGNSWFDRADGRQGYAVEDPNYEMLPVPGFGGASTQVDPAQAGIVANGRSPANLLASTFGDELFKATNGRSKVISASGKDRSAVSMAGHVGKAFWMSVATGAYETSTFYYEAYPEWAAVWNAGRPADAAVGTDWALSDPIETYLLAENDDRAAESDLKGFGRTFPHPYGAPEDGLYYTQVLLSPLGDQLTASFGKAAVLGETLGGDDAIDYLSLSFSGVDATNHFFGPSSLESEEMVRVLDRTLADLFAFLDDEVGRDHVLYVLSADHGMPELPEHMAEHGHDAHRNGHTALADDLNAEIAAAFGVQTAIKAFFRPYIYLDHDAIAAAGANRRGIERLIVDSLAARPGIAMAMPSDPFPEQRGDFLEGPIRRNYHPARSGDIYVVQSPYSFLLDPGAVAVMHGSPWRYDTHVPIMFAGPGINPSRVSRRVSAVDVATTLSDLFGTTMPSGASGDVLREIKLMDSSND